ncbi:Pdp3 protein [Saccharomycopsis crataegensis]|uniref:Pdp3 protein n=1 Tax=Saccharomycopsis crataegensis TaxID=43959 RepID=A0AAV5QGS3_9ASCO|nr:Pdp3 protein [Saccharomycopsis crataegensis]
MPAVKSKKGLYPKNYGNFQPGDRVLAKMSGFPPWPAFIPKYCHLTKKVLNARKSASKIPVFYYDQGDYGWCDEKNVHLLDEALLNEKLKAIDKNGKVDDSGLADNFKSISTGISYMEFRREVADDEADYNNGYYSDEDDPNREKKTKEAECEPKKKATSAKKARAASEGVGDTEHKKKKAKHDHGSGSGTNDKVLETSWRFRYILQKGLIQTKKEPTREACEEAAKTLGEMEQFYKKNKITVTILKTSKIHKVLRELLKKDSLKGSHDLHKSCSSLLQDWAPVIEELRKDKHGNGSGASNNGHHSRNLSDVSNISTKKEEKLSD